jgi:hypothetical protein
MPYTIKQSKLENKEFHKFGLLLRKTVIGETPTFSNYRFEILGRFGIVFRSTNGKINDRLWTILYARIFDGFYETKIVLLGKTSGKTSAKYSWKKKFHLC